jgi:urease subunit alpha
MFGAYGRALVESSLLFVSAAALDADIGRVLGLSRPLAPVANTRGGIGKAAMIHNGATPVIEVNPETYEVRADGELLVCAPAESLPMAQRYFLF